MLRLKVKSRSRSSLFGDFTVRRLRFKGAADTKSELNEAIKILKSHLNHLPKYRNTHKIVKND